MLEIVYPFLVVHLWLDFMEWLDAKLGTPFIHMVDEVGGLAWLDLNGSGRVSQAVDD